MTVKLHCVVSTKLFCCVSMQMFFSARKSLNGHAKISITSSYLNIIKCHSAVKCRYDSHVKAYNFTKKFLAFAEKRANDFRGYFFCRTWYITAVLLTSRFFPIKRRSYGVASIY